MKVTEKHLLVVGNNSLRRKGFIDDLVKKSDKLIYRLKPNIKSFDEYIEQVRIVFPFIPENWDEQNPGKWTRNQIWDFHLDWTNETHSILIVVEGFDEVEENWKIEILRDYIQTSYYQEKPKNSMSNFQLILSMESHGNIIDKICELLGTKETEKRSPEQIVKGKIKIIDLNKE